MKKSKQNEALYFAAGILFGLLIIGKREGLLTKKDKPIVSK